MNPLFPILGFRLSRAGRTCRRLLSTFQFGAAVGWVLFLSACSSGPTAPAVKGSLTATSQKANDPGSEAVSTNALVLIPKSIFRTGPQSGRDPFFPGSSRRVAQNAEGATAMKLPLISYLKLVGIRSGTARPMALINRTSLAQGEEGEVSIVVSNYLNKAEVQKVAVRCLEVRPDSVLINIAGEQGVKELRMAQGK